MKKRIFATALSSLLLFSAISFSSCNKEENGETQVTDPNAGNAELVLLNGFENFERDFQLLKLLNKFGQVNVNENAEYVRSGKVSAQLRPLGFGSSTAEPFLVLPTYSTRFEFGYGDFTNVDKLTFSVYNAEEAPIEMGVGLTKGAIASLTNRLPMVAKTSTEYFTLQSGWNEVEWIFDPAYMSMQDGFNLMEVQGVYLSFEGQRSFELDAAPTLYLDDVYIHYGEAKSTALDLGLKKDAEKGVWEILDFEKFSQTYAYWVNSPTTHCSTAKIVSAQDAGIIAETNNVLQTTIRPSFGQPGYSYLYFSGEPFKEAIAAIGEDIKTNPQNYVVKMDVFNASAVTQTLQFGFGVGEDWAQTRTISNLASGAWGTLEANCSTLGTKAGNLFVQDPANVRVLFPLYTTETDKRDRTFYFDNIRIEKVQEETAE